jgi:hypothetical protein
MVEDLLETSSVVLDFDFEGLHEFGLIDVLGRLLKELSGVRLKPSMNINLMLLATDVKEFLKDGTLHFQKLKQVILNVPQIVLLRIQS